MQTKTKYEETILKELREIPGEMLPKVMKILRVLKESIVADRGRKKERPEESGLCGIWKDKRSAETIIADIYEHRTGFGGRGVEL